MSPAEYAKRMGALAQERRFDDMAALTIDGSAPGTSRSDADDTAEYLAKLRLETDPRHFARSRRNY